MLTIRLFGQVRFELDGATQPLRAPAKALEALAYLATHHTVPVSRDFLATLLWPDDEPENGRAKLRRNLHVLVQALPKEDANYLLPTMQTVRWNAAAASVDAIAFAEAGAGGRLAEATAWYTGEFLEGYHDDWVLSERERLRDLQLEYLRTSVHRKRSERDLSGALVEIGRIFEIDPWREDVLRIELLVRSQLGDRSGALAAYRSFAQRLRAELDVEPTPETTAAFDTLVHGEVPVEAESLTGVAAASVARGPASLPFVGREDEFDTLVRAWSSAAHGKGRMLLVSGEAGAGKSRLAQELALKVESQGGGVLVGTTTPGEARPYEAVVGALRAVLSLVVSAHTPAELGVLARVLPEIGARTSIVEMQAIGPEAERARIFETVYAVVRELARKRPLLIILEDLHWATSSSAALIEYLVRRVSTLPVLIVGTYRGEEVDRAHPLRGLRRRLESEGILERLALARFDRATVTEIVRRFFTGRTDIDALAHDLYCYSEGVPLFLDEAIHSGNSRTDGPRLNVPERIERLGDAARVLVEIAAVVGSGFTIELLCEVAGWDEAEVLRALDELVESRFVRHGRQRNFGDYAFSHHLVQTAVYEGLPESTRRRRHLLVARASSMLYEDLPNRAGEIALHYDRGGDSAQAAKAYATAALHELGLYANDEALTHSERALALSTDPELVIEMQMVRTWVGRWMARADLRENALRAIESLSPTREQLPKVERLRAIHASLEGRIDEAWAAAERFLEAATAISDDAGIVQAYLEMSTVATTGDRYQEAEQSLQRASEAIPVDDEGAALRLMRVRTYLAQRRGAHDARLGEAAQQLLREARRVGDPQTEAEAHNRLAHVAMAEERFIDARTHFDAAGETYRRLGLRGRDGLGVNSANLAAWMAEYENATNLYNQCLVRAEETGSLGEAGCNIGLAFVDICTRELVRAKTMIESVAARCRGTNTLEEANVYLCRALIASETGDAHEANIQYDAALAIHRMKPPGILFAVTLAFATLSALDAGDPSRAAALDEELGTLSDAFLRGEEFPHLMLWARSRGADLRADTAQAAAFMHAAGLLYDARAEAIGPCAAAYAAVPWNARFLEARAPKSVSGAPRGSWPGPSSER